MKRINIVSFLLGFVMLAGLLVGCSGLSADSGDKISVVSTIFPPYDWMREVIGANKDNFELTLLLDSGIDMHSYSPTASDVLRLMDCDVFIYVGGTSDGWVEDVLKQSTNPDMIVVNLMDTLGDLVIFTEHGCGEDCDEEHAHVAGDGELFADEHICLSLRIAAVVCDTFAEVLAQADPDNAQTYKVNADAYSAKLAALDGQYQAVVDAADVSALVIADRFPFRYLTTDYGLTHYAAFEGCSADSSASFITIMTLANRLDQLGVGTVLVSESSDQKIAKSVIQQTSAKNHQILVLNSTHSVTASVVKSGATYLSIMESNLEVLRQALL